MTNKWPWGAPMCGVCNGNSYIVCNRSDGRQAIERCDACSSSFLSDEQAAALARRDGIECDDTYPCYLKGDQDGRT